MEFQLSSHKITNPVLEIIIEKQNLENYRKFDHGNFSTVNLNWKLNKNRQNFGKKSV